MWFTCLSSQLEYTGGNIMKNLRTKKLVLFAFLLTAWQHSAAAASVTATGPAALALAAVVAEHAPLIRYRRRVIARLFDGKVVFDNTKIAVTADSVVCQTSNVDITSRSCELTFGTSKRTVRGRQANEIYATIATAGVASEGAAGSTLESISKLHCTIDPRKIKQKAGGGADCTFETGQ
jgi:hypothetical protein